MNKNEAVLSAIDAAISTGIQRAAESKYQSVYQSAITRLKKMREIVSSGEAISKDNSPATPLDLYTNQVIEPIDMEYATIVAKATYKFDELYNFIDPDFLNLSE